MSHITIIIHMQQQMMSLWSNKLTLTVKLDNMKMFSFKRFSLEKSTNKISVCDEIF